MNVASRQRRWAQFLRRVRITLLGTAIDLLSVDERLQIRFAFARSIGSETDESSVDIFNLSPNSRAIAAAARRVRIEAGYGSALELIGEGDVREARSYRDGTEWITHFLLGSTETVRRAPLCEIVSPGPRR